MELQSLKNSATYKPAYSVSCKKVSFSGKQEYHHSIAMGMDIIYVDICGYTYRGYTWISQAFQKSKIILFSICWGPAKTPSLFTYYKLLIAGTGLDYTLGPFQILSSMILNSTGEPYLTSNYQIQKDLMSKHQSINNI